MSLLDEKYWASRYLENKIGWDLGKASQPIVTFFDSLKNKELDILLPGAGNSHEGIHLYQKGFKKTHLLDIALPVIDNLKQQFPFLADNVIHINYFEHLAKYDVIVEQTFFCALEPRFRESYVKHTHSLLKDGGFIIGLLFNFKNDDGPPFGGSILEYKELFEPYFEIAILEPSYNSEPTRQGKELFIKLYKK